MKTVVSGMLVLTLSIVLSLSFGYAGEKIKAVGMGTIHDNAVDIARDKAIDNAQRNAVEEKVGVMVTSFSEIENYQVKMDQILSESKGFINTYSIISEERDGDNYRVTIEADVGIGKLKDRMAAVNLIMVRKSKPRLMILFNDKNQKDAVAEASMIKYFISQGFTIVNPDSTKKIERYENIQSVNEDRKQLSVLAHRYGAEVVILAKVETTTKSFKMGDIEVSNNEAVVSGKVVNGDTGEIIATDSKTRKGDIKISTDEAARDLAKAISEQILERWSTELSNTVTIKMMISGLNNYRELSHFKELLAAKAKGLKQMHQRSYAGGAVELDIEIKGNAQSLADDVAAVKLDKKNIKIIAITQNKIEATITP